MHIRNTLEQKTQAFWNVSKACNIGQGPLENITTESAIELLGAIEDKVSWDSNLHDQVSELLDDIIGYGTVAPVFEDCSNPLDCA